MPTLFTIGYATKSVDTFICQLQRYNVDVVADIRSVPFSKVFTDFHQNTIETRLKKEKIRYVFLGDQLGPRSKDDAHYNTKGQVQFHKLMQSALFQQGLQRLKLGLEKKFTIALMCAEKDAATCHRSLLVGYYLQRHPQAILERRELTISHIDHDGETESQCELEARVLQLHDQGMDLFMGEEERKQCAYEVQLEKTSYIKPAE